MIKLPASVIRPILLFFADIGEDLLIAMDANRLLIRAQPGVNTHYLEATIERDAALAYRPPDHEDFVDKTLVMPTHKLAVILRPSFYRSVEFHLPTPERASFQMRMEHQCGTDKVDIMQKDIDIDRVSPPSNLDVCMSATLNATEFRDDINAFTALDFDAIDMVVATGSSVSLVARDQYNCITERTTIYTATADWNEFHGGKSTPDAPDGDGDDESPPPAADDGKKRKAKRAIAPKPITVHRMARSAWQLMAKDPYETMSVSTKILKQLTGTTSFCDTLTLESCVVCDAGQLMRITYNMNHEGIGLVAFLAPKIVD